MNTQREGYDQPPDTTAEVPVMITNKMRAALLGLGYTNEQIAEMTPLQALENLQVWSSQYRWFGQYQEPVQRQESVEDQPVRIERVLYDERTKKIRYIPQYNHRLARRRDRARRSRRHQERPMELKDLNEVFRRVKDGVCDKYRSIMDSDFGAICQGLITGKKICGLVMIMATIKAVIQGRLDVSELIRKLFL